MPELSRRQFLQIGGGSLLLPLAGCATTAATRTGAEPLRMGLIADLHHGLDPRAAWRLAEFVEAAAERRADCIVQLGDFNYGKPDDRPCMDLWNQFPGERYHVLGNHDMDFNDKAGMFEFWSMPGRYYSFDRGGYHFVVLDRNNLKTTDGYVPYARGNFYVAAAMRGHADPEQLDWLQHDLRTTSLPTVVLVHHGLGMTGGSYPTGAAAGVIEAELERANAEGARVVACFCGHHHLDRYAMHAGIHYLWINSASYYWVGGDYGRMAPYRDALFAFATFHPDGWLELEGRTTTWEHPSPAERGYPQAEDLTPFVSDRRLRLSGAPVT